MYFSVLRFAFFTTLLLSSFSPESKAESGNPLDSFSALKEGLDLRKKRYSELVQNAATRYRISPHFIHAIIHVESYYHPHLESRAGAVGLMQLMPKTAQIYGVEDRTDPKQNVNAGVQHLNDLLIRYNDNKYLALAAYNAGVTAVERYDRQIPPFRETQNYIRRVMEIYEKSRFSYKDIKEQ